MLNVPPPDLFTTWFLRVADTVIVILLVSFPLRLSSPKGVNIDMPNRHANTRQGVTRRWDMSTTNSSDQAREKKRLCRHRGLATYTHGDPAQHEQHSSQLAERTVGFLPQTQGRHGGEDKRKRVADRNGHGYVLGAEQIVVNRGPGLVDEERHRSLCRGQAQQWSQESPQCGLFYVTVYAPVL